MGRVLLSRTVLVGRLAGRDLRYRPAQAAALLLVIAAATATLTLGLALHGVTSQPYQRTRAATNGPDVVAYLPVMRPAGPRVIAACPGSSRADSRGRGDRPQRALSARRCGAAGPRRRGARPGGRAQSGARPGRPAEADRGPLGPAGRRGDRADLRRRARRRRRRPDHPERPALHGGRHRGHRGQPAVPESLLHQRRRLPCVSAGPGAATGRHQHRPDLDHRAGSRPAGHGRGPGDQLRPEPEAQRPSPGRGVRPPVRRSHPRPPPVRPGVRDRVAGHRCRGRPAGAGRAIRPVARGLAGLPAGGGQRGRAGRRPDGGAHPAGGAAQGGRQSPRDSSRPCCWPRT